MTIISRAYGLLGPLPLPFHASVSVTNVTQVLRAALISFGLVFGAAAGRGEAEGGGRRAARATRPGSGSLGDSRGRRAGRGRRGRPGPVDRADAGGAAAARGGRVETCTCRRRCCSRSAPSSSSVRLACGYFLNEPELEQAADHDRRVEDAEKAYAQAQDASTRSSASFARPGRSCAASDRQEALALHENDAHTDRRVYAHKAGNVPLYGLEAAGAAAVDEREDARCGSRRRGSRSGRGGRASRSPPHRRHRRPALAIRLRGLLAVARRRARRRAALVAARVERPRRAANGRGEGCGCRRRSPGRGRCRCRCARS